MLTQTDSEASALSVEARQAQDAAVEQDPDLAAVETRAAGDLPGRTEAIVRAEAPRIVTAQLAEAARMLRDGPVELTLSPEELGRVKLTLSATDGGMVLNVTAERAETLDLLRRNIDLLAHDLRDAGFSSLSFSFGEQGTPSEQARARREDLSADGPAPAIQAACAVRITGSGLDLRL